MLTHSFVYVVGDNSFQSMRFQSIDVCKLCAETACQFFGKVTTIFVIDTEAHTYSRYKQYSPAQTNWEYERDFEDEEES